MKRWEGRIRWDRWIREVERGKKGPKPSLSTPPSTM